MSLRTFGPRLSGLILGALVAGCAHRPPPLQPQLSLERADCDASLVLTGAVPILLDPKEIKPIDALVGDPGRCVQTADAVGDFYASFALPQNAPGYTLQIGALPQGFRLLAPEVRLLNDRGEVTRSFKADHFLFRGNQLSILVQPHPDETTMVVLSDHTIVGQTLSRVQEGLTTSYYTTITRFGSRTSASNVGFDMVAETTFSFAGGLRIVALPAT